MKEYLHTAVMFAGVTVLIILAIAAILCLVALQVAAILFDKLVYTLPLILVIAAIFTYLEYYT